MIVNQEVTLSLIVYPNIGLPELTGLYLGLSLCLSFTLSLSMSPFALFLYVPNSVYLSVSLSPRFPPDRVPGRGPGRCLHRGHGHQPGRPLPDHQGEADLPLDPPAQRQSLQHGLQAAQSGCEFIQQRMVVHHLTLSIAVCMPISWVFTHARLHRFCTQVAATLVSLIRLQANQLKPECTFFLSGVT